MKLQGELSINVIRAFRGVADLYYDRGQAVARRWPCTPQNPRTPEQQNQRENITRMHSALKEAPTQWHESWREQPMPAERSHEDLKRKLVLWTLANGNEVILPRILSVLTEWVPATGKTTFSIVIDQIPGADLTTIRWRYADADLPGIQKLQWKIIGYYNRRDDNTRLAVHPEVSDFRTISDQSYLPAYQAFRLRLAGPETNYVFLPFSEDPT